MLTLNCGAQHARIAAAGAHVVANPAHLPLDGALAIQRLGAVRAGAGRTYALNTLLQAPARLAACLQPCFLPAN